MDELFAFIKNHHLKPRVGRVFPFEQIGQAHLLMEQSMANGKVVVTMDREAWHFRHDC
ncbi:hypothetical protein D3C72_2446880 [compost metagenome]